MSYAITAPLNPFLPGGSDVIRRGTRVLYLYPTAGGVAPELRGRLNCSDTVEDVLFGKVKPQSGFGWHPLWVNRRGLQRWEQLGWLWGSPYEAGRMARVASASPCSFGGVFADSYVATDLAGRVV